MLLHRASRVDVKKLEKQEAKLKVSTNGYLRRTAMMLRRLFRPRSRNALVVTCTKDPNFLISTASRSVEIFISLNHFDHGIGSKIMKRCSWRWFTCVCFSQFDHSTTYFRLTPWKRQMLLKTRAKIYIYPQLTSILVPIVYCAFHFWLLLLVLRYPLSSGASLTLAYGRRYGLIGRNGTLYTWSPIGTTVRFHQVSESPPFWSISLCGKYLFPRILPYCSWSRR